MPGLPKSYIKKYGISKEAWKQYRKANKSSRVNRSVARPMPKKTRKRSIRRRVARRFRRKDKRIPLLTTIPIVKSVALEPLLGDNIRLGAIKMFQQTNNIGDAALEAANVLSLNFTGFSMKGPDAGTWYSSFPIQTYVPIVVGALASKFLGKYVNPKMAKIPILGKYVKL